MKKTFTLLVGIPLLLATAGLYEVAWWWIVGVGALSLLSSIPKPRPRPKPVQRPVYKSQPVRKPVPQVPPKPVPTMQEKLEEARRKLAALKEFAEQETDRSLKRAMINEAEAAYRRKVKQIMNE